MARTLIAILLALAVGGCIPIGIKGSSRFVEPPAALPGTGIPVDPR